MNKKYFIEVKKIFSLLEKSHTKELKHLFIYLFIGGFLETLTIAVLIPFISLVLKSEGSINILGLTENLLTIDNLGIFGLIVFLIFLIKSIFFTRLEFKSHKLLRYINLSLTSRLFKIYTNLEYKKIILKKSPIILRNLSSEIPKFIGGVLEPLIMVSKNGFIIIFLLIFLFQVNFKISLISILFAISFFIIVKFLLKKKLFHYGKIKQKFSGETNKIVTETFQGLKFIKSYGLENLFIKNFQNVLLEIANVDYKSSAYRSLPRVWIEFIVIFLIILTGSIVYFLGDNLNNFLFSLSVLLLCLIKILPALLSIINVVNTYQYNKSSINLLMDELKESVNKSNDDEEFKIKKKFENKIVFDHKISFKNIKFKFDGMDNYLLENLNLEIKRSGEIIGIYGDSGSGKTTLIDILIGLHIPDNIDCQIDERKIPHNIYNFLEMNLFGYVPQNTFIFDDTIENNILLSKKNKDFAEKNLKKILEEVELSSYINCLKDGLNSTIGENGQFISGGQKQRIGIARALINDPKILIFDEATNALDQKLEENIFNLIKKLSKKLSCIIISHDPNIRNYCNKVFKLENGILIEK